MQSMWCCDNVGGLGEHVKKHVLWFLRYYVIYLHIISYGIFDIR